MCVCVRVCERGSDINVLKKKAEMREFDFIVHEYVTKNGITNSQF